MILNKRKLTLTAVLLVLALFLTAGCSSQPQPSPLSVTLMRVGKADAIALLSGSHALLIDTGEEEDGEEILEFLRSHQIQSVDAMIITHFDKDHVGGADTVLRGIPVDTVYLPDYQGTHKTYRKFLEAAGETGVPLQRLSQPVTVPFADAEVLIEPPQSYEIPEGVKDWDNDFSLITTVIHGDNRLVFLGDAETRRIRQWLESGSAEKADFLKVPHHGVYDEVLEELFSALTPEISVICDSRKNPADPETLTLLRRFSSRIYETKDGNVTVLSDGRSLKSYQDK